MNKKSGHQLKWKDDNIEFKLSTGTDFQYQLKHDETAGHEGVYLIKYEESSETPLTQQLAQTKQRKLFKKKAKEIRGHDNGSEGFQFILCDGGFAIQFGSYKLILRKKLKKSTGKSEITWSTKHKYYHALE